GRIGFSTTSSSRPWSRSKNGTGPPTPVTSTAPSSSTIGSRRRAAAIASPSRVCAFSRTSSSSRAACQVARSTTGGLPGRLLLALPGLVVMVSSAVYRGRERNRAWFKITAADVLKARQGGLRGEGLDHVVHVVGRGQDHGVRGAGGFVLAQPG